MFSKFSSWRLAVFALICSAVTSLIMSSDAARAHPMTTQKLKGGKHLVQRRWFTPQNSHPVGLHSPKSGREIETSIKTETRGAFRPTPLIIERPLNTPRFAKGTYRYHPKSLQNGRFRLGMNKVQKGNSGNAKRPVNNAFPRQAQQTERYEEWLSRDKSNVHSQKVPQNEDLFKIHRKNTLNKIPHQFQQRSISQARGAGPKGAPVRLNGNNSVKKASVFPSQTSGFWNTVMSPPGGRRLVHNKANGRRTGATQSSKFHKVSNLPTPRVPSLGNNFVSSVIKRDPNPKRVAPSIRDFFQPRGSVSSSDAYKHKKVKSYHVKDAQTLLATITGDVQEALNSFSEDETMRHEQNRFVARGPQHFGFESAEPHQKSPAEPFKVKGFYRNNFVSQFGGGSQGFNTNQPITTVKQASRPRGYDAEKFFPSSLEPSRGRLASKGGKSFSGQANTTTRGPLLDYKAGQSDKRLFDLRSFDNPLWEAVKTPSTFLGFGNGKDYNIAKVLPPVPSKSSFNWKEPPTSPPAQPNKMTHMESYLYPFVTETKTVKPPKIFTSGFRRIHRVLSESEPQVGKPKDTKLQIYKKIFSLKGPEAPPSSVAETSLLDPRQGLEPRIPQIWMPRSVRAQRWNNHTADQEAEGAGGSTARPTKPNKAKPFVVNLGTNKPSSRVTPDKNSNNPFFDHIKFWLNKNTTDSVGRKMWLKNMDGKPVTAFHPSLARPIGGLEIQPKESKKPISRKAILLMNTPFSRSMRGKHEKGKHANNFGELAMRRRPKHPARIKPLTNTDILGRVSFSAARASLAANGDYHPSLTANAKQPEWGGQWVLSSDDSANGSTGPETKTSDLIPAEKKEPKEGIEEIKRLQIVFDMEESGSGSFSLPDSGWKAPPT